MKIKGLFLKNWYTLNKNIKITAVIFFIIWIGGIFVDIIAPMFFYPCILGCAVAFSLWHIEEAGWGKYAFSLPYSEKEIVLSKYILDAGIKVGLLLMFLLSMGIRSIIFDVPFFTSVSVFAIVVILALYIISFLLLPLYFKLRGKIVGIMYFLIGAFSGGLGIMFIENKELLSYDGLAPFLTVLFCIFVLSAFLSYHLSLRQYKKSDF